MQPAATAGMVRPEGDRRSGRRLLALACDAWALALTVVLLWPLLTAGGLPLARDLVFTPEQPLRGEWLGLGDAPARAVPLDLVVSLADLLVNGAVLSRLMLVGILFLAGAAAHRLVPRAHPVARVIVSGAAVWNPFVVERLALGQWALLAAYAAAFAIIGACLRFRRSPGWGSAAAVLVALLPAALTPTGAVVGAALALVLGLGGGRRRNAAALLAVAVLVQLPWLLPTLLGPAALLSDPNGVAAFASRSERPGGVIWSLFGLGGIWDAGSAPASRSGAFGHVMSLLVLAALLGGWRRLGRLMGAVRVRLAAAGSVGLLLAVASSTGPGGDLVRIMTEHVPGAGLLRDAQKWLLPFAVWAVMSAGAAADALLAWIRVRVGAVVPTAALVLTALPVVCLPDATTAVWPTVTPVSYPRDLSQIAAIVDGSRQSVLSLPWEPYRQYDWGNALAVHDPASRWFDAPVVMSDRLRVGERRLRGESTRSARVEELLGSPGAGAPELASVGVRWVLVQRDTPLDEAAGTGLVARLDGDSAPGLTQRFSGPDFVLWEVAGPWADPLRVEPWRTGLVIAADALVAGVAALAGGVMTRELVIRRRRLPAGMLHRTQRGR